MLKIFTKMFRSNCSTETLNANRQNVIRQNVLLVTAFVAGLQNVPRPSLAALEEVPTNLVASLLTQPRKKLDCAVEKAVRQALLNELSRTCVLIVM
jgi:hypothetical protein